VTVHSGEGEHRFSRTVNSNAGQGKRGGTGASMLHCYLERGGLSADWLLGWARGKFPRSAFRCSGESPILTCQHPASCAKPPPCDCESVMVPHQPVQHGIGHRGSPIHSCQCSVDTWTGHDRGAVRCPVINDLQQARPTLAVHRRHASVVEQQDIFADLIEPLAKRAVDVADTPPPPSRGSRC